MIFQELDTKAHDMEVKIANCHDNSFNFIESEKDKVEFKKNIKFFKNLTKEAMSISTKVPTRIKKCLNWKIKRAHLLRMRSRGIPH